MLTDEKLPPLPSPEKVLVRLTAMQHIEAERFTSLNAQADEIDRLTEEVGALRAEVEALRAALAELVACNDLKGTGMRNPDDEDEYFRRKPLAWAGARAALAQAKDAEAQ